jgi:hypothetical protein
VLSLFVRNFDELTDLSMMLVSFSDTVSSNNLEACTQEYVHNLSRKPA